MVQQSSTSDHVSQSSDGVSPLGRVSPSHVAATASEFIDILSETLDVVSAAVDQAPRGPGGPR